MLTLDPQKTNILREEIRAAFADVPLPPKEKWIDLFPPRGDDDDDYWAYDTMCTLMVDGEILPMRTERDEQAWQLTACFCSDDMRPYIISRLMLETLRDNFRLLDGDVYGWLPFSFVLHSWGCQNSSFEAQARKTAACHWVEAYNYAFADEDWNDLGGFPDTILSWIKGNPDYTPLFLPRLTPDSPLLSRQPMKGYEAQIATLRQEIETAFPAEPPQNPEDWIAKEDDPSDDMNRHAVTLTKKTQAWLSCSPRPAWDPESVQIGTEEKPVIDSEQYSELWPATRPMRSFLIGRHMIATLRDSFRATDGKIAEKTINSLLSYLAYDDKIKEVYTTEQRIAACHWAETLLVAGATHIDLSYLSRKSRNILAWRPHIPTYRPLFPNPPEPI